MPRPSRRETARFDPPISTGVIAILLAMGAMIITLSFFGKAGTLGVILNEWILSFLFGNIRYGTPFILLFLAWFLVKDVEYTYRRTHGIGVILLFITLSGAFHFSYVPEAMWFEAVNGHGGGVFGMLAWPLKTYLGSIASVVLLVGLGCVSLILLFNIPITHIIHSARGGSASVGKKIVTRIVLLVKGLIATVKLLSVRSPSGLQIQDTYTEDSDKPEDEREISERRFFSRPIDEQADESTAVGSPKIPPTETALREDNDDEGKLVQPAWTRQAIIKDVPPLDLLSSKRGKPTSGDIEANAAIIENTLHEFGIDVTMGEVRVGPTVTQYSLKPSKGIKLSRITGLSNDLALALAAHPIRIEAPIPGKSLVGIEVPNQKAAMVTFKELLETKEFRDRHHNMMIALGKDVAGRTWFADLPRMPHLLIAGATGSGKTVCINTVIMSLLYQNTAETLRMIMVDPKRVELTLYNGIPHLLTPVITNTQKTIQALKWTIGEMDRRFEILSQAGSRDIISYNRKFSAQKLPHIIFIIDELADLMATAANEIEAGIIRLAQMARAVGIHLIVATQRPSVDIITGLMKANIPARVAFSVASLIDSRTILDTPGAEKLLGRGDMLFLTAELSKPVRLQGAFMSEEEVYRIVEYLKGDEEPMYEELVVSATPRSGTLNMFGGPTDDRDPLFEEAKRVILEAGKASASLLQRRLKLGYARAARILDELEEAGVIGAGDGAKPRELLVTASAEYDTMDAGGELNVFEETPTDEPEPVTATDAEGMREE